VDASKFVTRERVIAIGASTGGTQAITEIITSLPASTPGIVVVLHMPELFVHSFAERLDHSSEMDVKVAPRGERITGGKVLIAPGDKHLVVRSENNSYFTDLTDGEMVNFVKPSVDVLFRSVAESVGEDAIGIILTGMGEDGARGLLEMKKAGAFTIVQDEATSTIFGMPKKAIEFGAAHRVAPLWEIPKIILDTLQNRQRY
jgi:two-component system chemotaxis response regulator CheB